MRNRRRVRGESMQRSAIDIITGEAMAAGVSGRRRYHRAAEIIALRAPEAAGGGPVKHLRQSTEHRRRRFIDIFDGDGAAYRPVRPCASSPAGINEASGADDDATMMPHCESAQATKPTTSASMRLKLSSSAAQIAGDLRRRRRGFQANHAEPCPCVGISRRLFAAALAVIKRRHRPRRRRRRTGIVDLGVTHCGAVANENRPATCAASCRHS